MLQPNFLYIVATACLLGLKQLDSLPVKAEKGLRGSPRRNLFEELNATMKASQQKETDAMSVPSKPLTKLRLFPMELGPKEYPKPKTDNKQKEIPLRQYDDDDETTEPADDPTAEPTAEGGETTAEPGAGSGGAGGGGTGNANGGGGEEENGGAAGGGAAGGAGGGAAGGAGGGGEGGEGGGAGGGAGGGGASGGGAGGGGAGAGGPVTTTKQSPNFVKDEQGNWVYNLWGATYGNRWLDTRFVNGKTRQHIKIDSDAVRDYYPDGELSTVCMAKSTIYNFPAVKKWLVRKIYNSTYKHRPIWRDLRFHIYQKGNSEECHNVEQYPKWRDYQECTVRRNMRLESLIPMYPMHQLGWGFPQI